MRTSPPSKGWYSALRCTRPRTAKGSARPYGFLATRYEVLCASSDRASAATRDSGTTGRYAREALLQLARLFALTTALFFELACSGASAGPPPGGSGNVAGAAGLEGDVTCADDSRVDTYTAGLAKPGAAGELTFTLFSSEPAPPAKGGNTFEVSVADGSGAVAAGDLRLELLMPDHGHGTQVPAVVTFDVDTQRFTLSPVYLFMAGVWRVELALYDDAEAATPRDHATFYFCIEG